MTIFWKWMTAATILLLLGIALTVPALKVDFSQGPALLAVVATQDSVLLRQGAVGIFTYSDGPAGVRLEWTNTAGPTSSDLLLLISNATACTAFSSKTMNAAQLEAADVTAVFFIDGEATFTSPKKIVVPSGSGIASVSCKLDFKPMAATYSQRRFQIVSDVKMGAHDAQWTPLGTNAYTLSPQDAEDLKVSHADRYAGSMYYDNTWLRVSSSDVHPIAVQWEDEEADRVHEFIYFVAAAIIGLSVSCMLEAVRPWIVGRSDA
jgi:hypothetical protein